MDRFLCFSGAKYWTINTYFSYVKVFFLPSCEQSAALLTSLSLLLFLIFSVVCRHFWSLRLIFIWLLCTFPFLWLFFRDYISRWILHERGKWVREMAEASKRFCIMFLCRVFFVCVQGDILWTQFFLLIFNSPRMDGGTEGISVACGNKFLAINAGTLLLVACTYVNWNIDGLHFD